MGWSLPNINDKNYDIDVMVELKQIQHENQPRRPSASSIKFSRMTAAKSCILIIRAYLKTIPTKYEGYNLLTKRRHRKSSEEGERRLIPLCHRSHHQGSHHKLCRIGYKDHHQAKKKALKKMQSLRTYAKDCLMFEPIGQVN